MKRRIPVILYLLLALLIACVIVGVVRIHSHHSHLKATSAAFSGPTIGSTCTMEEVTFTPDVFTAGEKTAWYWSDSKGHFCADMHHVHNPGIGMDDYRAVYIIGANRQSVFQYEEDAVNWVNSEPYVYRGTR